MNTCYMCFPAIATNQSIYYRVSDSNTALDFPTSTPQTMFQTTVKSLESNFVYSAPIGSSTQIPLQSTGSANTHIINFTLFEYC